MNHKHFKSLIFVKKSHWFFTELIKNLQFRRLSYFKKSKMIQLTISPLQWNACHVWDPKIYVTFSIHFQTHSSFNLQGWCEWCVLHLLYHRAAIMNCAFEKKKMAYEPGQIHLCQKICSAFSFSGRLIWYLRYWCLTTVVDVKAVIYWMNKTKWSTWRRDCWIFNVHYITVRLWIGFWS